jgi:2-desacetyl-2-hydroxyethyl bacteriochlorophyllide A dehydrogenase
MNLSNTVDATQIWFTGTQKIELRQQNIGIQEAHQVLVQTEYSAISAGTEMLVYRNQIPDDLSLDSSIPELQKNANYPLQYGYASVGEIIGIGSSVDHDWLGQRVFAFQPHASHFVCNTDALIKVPVDISADNAIFLANMETAVNLVQDGNPQIGENVVVFGLGIVGLLLNSLLSRFPLAELYGVDRIATRRELAKKSGAQTVLHPDEINQLKLNQGADLIYEVTGSPLALNQAIDLSGFASRIVIGSWYGNKSAAIELGGKAHRNRLQIITSQVSSIAPTLSGRWNKNRRFELAWEMIRQIQPAHWISHKSNITDCETIYQILDQQPAEVLQAVFYYRN